VWKSKCLFSQLSDSRSNLSRVLPESGNTQFPGETKLLLYHSGPQVFQCSLTVSCKRRGKRTFTDANLSPPHTHTSALCNVSAFSKGHQGAISLILFPIGMQQQFALTNVPYAQSMRLCLIFFFFCDIESQPHLASAAVDLEQSTRITGLMCYMCQDDHQSSECNHSI